MIFIIFQTPTDHLISLFLAINMRDFNFPLPFFARHILVSQKIMTQTIYYNMRQFRNIIIDIISRIMFQYGNNFIISFISIQHPESADRAYTGNNIPMGNRTFCQYTNIQRVAISHYFLTLRLLHRILCHQIAAITLWNKTI